jgi:hypothetical protein
LSNAGAGGHSNQRPSDADFHTCMDYADNPDEDKAHPNAHDYEQLASIYSHLDSGTTIGASATAARGSDVASTHRVSRSKIVTPPTLTLRGRSPSSSGQSKARPEGRLASISYLKGQAQSRAQF